MTEQEGPSLAAFFSQPADEDEPEASIAAFYAQPADEEVDNAEAPYFPGGGEGVTPETLVGGSQPWDALEAAYGGTITGLVMQVENEAHARILWIAP